MEQSRKIVVTVPLLTREEKEQICACAGSAGMQVVFCDTPQAAREQVSDAEVIYGLDASLAKSAPKLCWFHAMSAGIDAFLAPGVLPDHVMLSNSTGAYGVTLAEHTLMVTLEILRRHPEYQEAVREHRWQQGLKQSSIKDSRVTILGTGDLGTEIAKRIRAFEPAVLIGVNRSGRCDSEVFDRIVKTEDTDQILPETDILIMCLPGTKETEHFMNAERIALLPETSYLVNVGRGSSLDQEALCKALREERLAYAALDVFEKEPLQPEDPVWDCPRLLVTPHVAGFLTVPYTKRKNVEIFCANLKCYAAGEKLPTLVNRSRGY